MTNRTAIVIDAQLLVLMVVGTTSLALIAKHKKTRQFDVDDFRLLNALIGARPLILLPNTITEASNHLMWHAPPERDLINETLRKLVDLCDETFVESRRACSQSEFLRLGVADGAILAMADDHMILTADAALYLASQARGLRAVNFNHERERYGLV